MDHDSSIKRLLKEAKKMILSSDIDDIHKGLKLVKKVIKGDPENKWAFIYYGVGASKSEKYSHEAISAFDTAANICPDLLEAWKGLRSCLEAKKTRSDRENELLRDTYINLLRLENDDGKWNSLYTDIVACFNNLSCSDRANILSSLIEDTESNPFKHKIACEALANLTFQNEILLETNTEDVLKGFISCSRFFDFIDRPEFCQKVCSFLLKTNHLTALSTFLYQSILIYSPKTYTKLQIMEYLIAIASDSLYNVENLIPLISDSLREIEHVKISQIKVALSIINFYEQDFSSTRQSLENLSCSGDINASILLLKFLCKAKDYESVMFLCTKFINVFSNLKNEKFKLEFITCLIEALSSSNELTFLHCGLKLVLKALSKYGEDTHLICCLTHIYIGLCDARALFYLDKLPNRCDEMKYLLSLLVHEVPDYSQDSGRWVISALSSANQDLIKGNVKRALKTFTKIGVKDKLLSEPFLILGVDSIAKGDVVKAAMCFHRAFQLRPLDLQILKHYLDSLFKLSDEEQALKVIDSVCLSNFGKWHFIGEKALFASGLIHSAKSNHEKSIRSFKHLLKLNPEYTEFVEAITNEYIKLGRLGIAENYVSRLVADDPYDLHSLLLLAQIYKFDVNYSSYFNQSIRCLNFDSNEVSETERITKLLLCFFIHFLRNISKIEETSLDYLSTFFSKSLININNIANKVKLVRSHDNEYLVAVYLFIESHLIAALKIMKCNERVVEANELFIFCIKALGGVFEVYGAGHLCFWKLLGDVLLFSSHLSNEIDVMSWLVDDLQKNYSTSYTCTPNYVRINLAIKCYATGLHLSKQKCPKRIHEFYYDISVALIYLSNHSKIVCPEVRYYCLKSSLEACLKSFKHSDGTGDSRWVHSNLLGVIVTLLGIKENLFKEHFSPQELRVTEGIMLQNYATHLAKSGLYNHAEDMFEQARLRVDIDYSSSWVGQLLMQLINKDIDTKKMLQYNLTQIGEHSLLKWILAYFLAHNKLTINFHGGQYSMLTYVFSEQHCMTEVNPCRLAIMGFIHEQIGNHTLARRLYFRSLRFAKFVDEDTFNAILGNAVRLNNRCKENCELISQFGCNSLSNAITSLFILSSNHITLPNINKYILDKVLILMKSVVDISSSEDNSMRLIIPLLCLLTDLNLLQYADIQVPYLLDYMYKNIKLFARFGRKEFKQILSSMDGCTRDQFFKTIEKNAYLNESVNLEVGCLVSDDPVVPFVERSADTIMISGSSSDEYCMTSSTQSPSNKDSPTADNFNNHNITSNGNRLISVSEKSDYTNEIVKKQSDSFNPYSKVLNNLRSSVFPFPLTDEEKMVIQRNRLLKLQKTPEKLLKPIKIQGNSYLNVIEDHGCHGTCQMLVSLLQKSISIKNHTAALNYALLCLNIRCCSCMLLDKLLPLICYISIESNNLKLMQKAYHLYPSNPLLRKTIFWFKSKIIL